MAQLNTGDFELSQRQSHAHGADRRLIRQLKTANFTVQVNKSRGMSAVVTSSITVKTEDYSTSNPPLKGFPFTSFAAHLSSCHTKSASAVDFTHSTWFCVMMRSWLLLRLKQYGKQNGRQFFIREIVNMLQNKYAQRRKSQCCLCTNQSTSIMSQLHNPQVSSECIGLLWRRLMTWGHYLFEQSIPKKSTF